MSNMIVHNSEAAITEAVQALVKDHSWVGTATDLLTVLNENVDESITQHHTWPSSPWALSSTLRRLVPDLQADGIEIQFRREAGRLRRRIILLRQCEEDEEILILVTEEERLLGMKRCQDASTNAEAT